MCGIHGPTSSLQFHLWSINDGIVRIQIRIHMYEQIYANFLRRVLGPSIFLVGSPPEYLTFALPCCCHVRLPSSYCHLVKLPFSMYCCCSAFHADGRGSTKLPPLYSEIIEQFQHHSITHNYS